MMFALVFVVAVLPYLYVLACEFTYDDHWTILGNRALRRPLGSLLGALYTGDAATQHLPDASRPAMVFSNAIDLRLFGTNPFGHHLHSLALHGAVCMLAYGLAFVLTRRRRTALATALVFGCVPVHTEVVASVHYREDLIATGMLFVFFVCLLRPTDGHLRRGAPLFASLALLWGLLAKESAMVVVLLGPLLIAACGLDRRALERRAPILVGALAVVVLYGSWRLGIAAFGDGIPRSEGMSWAARWSATARYMLVGVGNALVPLRSVPINPPLGQASWSYIPGAIVCVGVMLAALTKPRTRVFGAALAFMLVAPLASSPLVGAANEVADRFFYASSFGGALCIALSLDVLRERRGAPVYTVLLTSLLLVASALSVRASLHFANDVSLFTRAVELSPRSARAYTALSFALRVRGELADAERHARTAIALDPSYPRARIGLAATHILMGREDEGRAELEALARTEPDAPGLVAAMRCLSGSASARERCINGRRPRPR